MRSQFDVFIEYKLTHSLLGALAKRLPFLWRINEGESDPDLLFGSGQHFDRVAVGYSDTVDMPERRFLRQSMAAEEQKSEQDMDSIYETLRLIRNPLVTIDVPRGR